MTKKPREGTDPLGWKGVTQEEIPNKMKISTPRKPWT